MFNKRNSVTINVLFFSMNNSKVYLSILTINLTKKTFNEVNTMHKFEFIQLLAKFV